jgi:hypothetical protein
VSDRGEAEDDLIVFPDLEPHRVGTVLRFGQEPIACYDLTRVLAQYVADGMTEEEAEEHFSFNVIGAWVGERTPCFLVRTEDSADG